VSTFEGPPVDSVPGVGTLTLAAFLGEIVERFADAEAVVLDDDLRDGETVRWTYRRLGDEAHRVARALIANGVRPGQTVGVLMGNRPEALASIFGAALAGAVAAPMSTFAAAPEIAEMVDRSGAVVVLTQARLKDRALATDVSAAIQAHAGASDRVGLDPAAPRKAVVGEPSWDEFLAGGDAVDPAEVAQRTAAVDPDDPGLVIFSSGTTSRPKGVLHAHRSPTLQFWIQAAIFGRHAATRMFTALPLFWTAGLNTAVGSTLAVGGCCVLQEVFGPGAALRLMERERVTEPYTLPHQTQALAEHPDWASTDLSALRCVYGKSAYARHPSVEGDTGWIMPVGYGLSETCAFVSGHPSDTPRERAEVGHGPLVAGTRVRILGDDGTPLAAGQEGEIAVAGATRLLGYLGDDGQLAPTDRIDGDGFFHTGDVGSVDAEGVLHYEGRLTEMIKTGGANVSPAEVEVQLRRLPEIKLSRVLGLPDDRLGEVVVACLVLQAGAHLDAEAVRTMLREQLAAYKVPRHVLFLDDGEMPMGDTDAKVRDDVLRALVSERLALTPTPTPGGR